MYRLNDGRFIVVERRKNNGLKEFGVEFTRNSYEIGSNESIYDECDIYIYIRRRICVYKWFHRLTDELVMLTAVFVDIGLKKRYDIKVTERERESCGIDWQMSSK